MRFMFVKIFPPVTLLGTEGSARIPLITLQGIALVHTDTEGTGYWLHALPYHTLVTEGASY